jgi:predicted AAA+ superfamily ATPase
MALSNRERVGKSLDLLCAGLAPFVERELKAVHGDKWQEIAREGQPNPKSKIQNPKSKPRLDTQALLAVMWNQWNHVFSRTLGMSERSIVSELRDVRNKWAHQEAFSSSDAYRALDNMERMLAAVSAEQAGEVGQMRMDLLRVQFDEQRRGEMRKASFAPTEGKPQGGLKPWREVVTPHSDVVKGTYQQAEFAADLWQVYQNEGADEYKNPIEFFRRTFITEGLKGLLTGALVRLASQGGSPVVELQTNFGGGKTHSMMSLWHLFSGISPSELLGADELVKEAGVPVATGVHRAVLVGTKISPGQTHKKPDGTVVRTLWGELAWQLGGKPGYEMVKEDDEKGTNPGDTLKKLFNRFAPCLILIDEWIAYARQLRDEVSLPAGTFDTQFTFAQALSEAAKAAKRTVLVVSIPESKNEIGGSFGQAALEQLKNAIGRVESPWHPARPDESFEIVRRRLFEPMTGDQFIARDAVAKAFSEMYGSQHQEFPPDCREAGYERRVKMAYPIHPELFDRLHNDWSALDKFQRTRGVLRLMAAVIHSLWDRQDCNLLILPATVPIDDPKVQDELTRYLEDQWMPIIEKDVDGPNSLPLMIDRETPTLGRYSACRRVARTIYMGSAPMQKAANRGIDDRQVKLGCVQPGEAVATFGDALRRLTDRATYLYVDGKRYWYSTQPTVTRLADDRASQRTEDDINEEISRRLRGQAGKRDAFSKVHVCCPGSDIPDERTARLVVLGPEFPHTAKNAGSAARKEALAILESRGNSPRSYRNTLVMLAADVNRLRELQSAVRQFLAWDSIWDDRETLNLDPFQTKQAETKLRTSNETVDARIPETFQWLLVPGQSDPKGDIEWTEIRLQGQDPLAVRATKKLKNEELLMIELGDVRLRHELDRVPLWRGNHVGVKQLAEDMAKYLYLPRLRDDDVLLAAIQQGVAPRLIPSETFAFADRWDEQKKRYVGLSVGRTVRVLLEGESVLVRPDVAAAQLAAEQAQPGTTVPAGNGSGAQPIGIVPSPGTVTLPVGPVTPPVVEPPKPRRFFGSVKLDPVRLARDADRIAQEVVQHLSGMAGAELEVTLEVHADIPSGASPEMVRTITENCRTLGFDPHGFEES